MCVCLLLFVIITFNRSASKISSLYIHLSPHHSVDVCFFFCLEAFGLFSPTKESTKIYNFPKINVYNAFFFTFAVLNNSQTIIKIKLQFEHNYFENDTNYIKAYNVQKVE